MFETEIELFNQKKAELDELRKKLSMELADKILEQPNVHCIISQGYTPYFNDGEPCEHGDQTYINVDCLDDFTENAPDSSLWGWGEIYDLPLDSVKELIGYDFDYSTYVKVDSKPYDKVLEIIGEYLHSIYGTNYHVIIYKKDGETKLEYSDYSDHD